MTVVRTQGLFTVSPQWTREEPAIPRTPVNPAGVEANAPPSSYAVAAALDGEEGAILRLVGLTFLRGVFVLPGLWAVSRLTKTELGALQLLALSFGGSATITLGMLGYYYIQRRITQWRQPPAFPVGP